MVVFGVPHLDEALASDRGPILVANQPGTQAEPFLWQAARHHLKAGGDVVYLTTDRPPKRVQARLAANGGLHIMDAFSSLHGIIEPGVENVPHPENPSEIATHLEKMHVQYPEAMLILDSISGLAVRGDPHVLEAAGPRLMEAIQKFPISLALHSEFGPPGEMEPFLQRFPTKIHLRAIQDRIITNHYFCLERVSGEAVDHANPVLYRADDDRVRVFVPKIVVTGAADAGKTTFVHAVSDHAVSAERKGATVAMDKGTVDRDGLRVEVFGTPGQERFDPIVKPIMAQAVGIVLILDSTDPDSFQRGKDMLDMGWRKGLSALVIANKQDQAGAMAPEAVRQAIDLPESIPVVGCVATDPAKAREALHQLITRILTQEVPT